MKSEYITGKRIFSERCLKCVRIDEALNRRSVALLWDDDMETFTIRAHRSEYGSAYAQLVEATERMEALDRFNAVRKAVRAVA